ncbi:hypothetical protein [Skermania piniformis]|uniref:Uncharacterized protein n=1 Tax=Skermania pinensis TaxID=39122 RepID=A0ABX8S4G5_9ACTN|nr:hypothetical protein [Skermania piniformis]QXQ12704.1 hypothetical protein KV203_12185 [Skermania piniformis]
MAVEFYSRSLMSSEATPHTARCVGGDSWVVSWLPGRTISGDQAAAAMSFASALAAENSVSDTAWSESTWAALDSWAAALGLTAREAAFMVRLEHHPLVRSGTCDVAEG